MAIVKISGFIQALAALLARKGPIIPPPRPRYQMNRTLSGPKHELSFCLIRESKHDYLFLSHSLLCMATELSLLFTRLLSTRTEEISSSGNTSLYSEDAAFESQQRRR